MNFKTILFDYSGTIGDDFDKCFTVVNKMLNNRGLASFTLWEFKENVFWPYEDFLAKYMDDKSGEDLIKELLETTEKTNIKDKPIPGSKETFEFLKKRGVKIIVFTAISNELIEQRLKEFYGNDLIDEVWGGHENKKNDLPGLLDKANIKLDEAAFVGDAVQDALAAKAAKIYFIGVKTGWQNLKLLKAADPDLIIDSVADLPSFFE